MPRNLEGIRDRPELIRTGFPTKHYRRSWGGFGAWPFKPAIVGPSTITLPAATTFGFCTCILQYSLQMALNLSNSQRCCFKKSLTFK